MMNELRDRWCDALIWMFMLQQDKIDDVKDSFTAEVTFYVTRYFITPSTTVLQ
jgi:hypothetical protein